MRARRKLRGGRSRESSSCARVSERVSRESSCARVSERVSR